jgi:hypothetical protein
MTLPALKVIQPRLRHGAVVIVINRICGEVQGPVSPSAGQEKWFGEFDDPILEGLEGFSLFTNALMYKLDA